MTTALDIIQDALEKLQKYAAGETLSDVDAERGLVVLNDMVDSLSNEALACYVNIEQSVTLLPAKYQYTIGPATNVPAPDIPGTRPLDLLTAPGSAYVLDQTGNRYEIQVVPQDKWNQIGNVLQVNANIPNTLFYDAQNPLGILNFSPVPNIGYQVFFDSRLQLTEFPNLAAQINLPLGYTKMYKDNLAVELFPYFAATGEQINPVIVTAALASKARVKRTNMRDVVARYDSELISKSSATYNVYRGY